MLLGGVAFCLGALICLIYLLVYKLWKVPMPTVTVPAEAPAPEPPIKSDHVRP